MKVIALLCILASVNVFAQTKSLSEQVPVESSIISDRKSIKPVMPVLVRCPKPDEQRFVLSEGMLYSATSQYIKYSQSKFKILSVSRTEGKYIPGTPLRPVDKDLMLDIAQNAQLKPAEVYLDPLGLSVVYIPVVGKTLPDPNIVISIIRAHVADYDIAPQVFPECSIPFNPQR